MEGPYCPECGSERVSEPDDDAMRDCFNCGVWFPDGDTRPVRFCNIGGEWVGRSGVPVPLDLQLQGPTGDRRGAARHGGLV